MTINAGDRFADSARYPGAMLCGHDDTCNDYGMHFTLLTCLKGKSFHAVDLGVRM